MPKILDQKLYDTVSAEAKKVFDKPSAYRSLWTVREYKKRGGRYADDGKPKELAIWVKERWQDIGGKDYPVFRPTKRVNSKTPLLASEIDPKNLKAQIKRKQIIKGTKNLDPFIPK